MKEEVLGRFEGTKGAKRVCPKWSFVGLWSCDGGGFGAVKEEDFGGLEEHEGRQMCMPEMVVWDAHGVVKEEDSGRLGNTKGAKRVCPKWSFVRLWSCDGGGFGAGDCG